MRKNVEALNERPEPPNTSRLLMKGYRLTTAEILYHLPDYPCFLQTYVWQELDLAPEFPVLHKFIEFWRADLEGALHSVRVSATGLISPHEDKSTDCEFSLH